jgi:chitinase
MQTNIDFIWVQFYNNPSCDINSGSQFISALQSWSTDLASGATYNTRSSENNASTGITPRLYIGASASSAVNSGFVDVSDFSLVLESVRSAKINNLGGTMFWDGVLGEESAGVSGQSFMQITKSVLG